MKANEFVEAGPHDFRLGAPEPAPAGHWSPYAMEPDCDAVWWARTPCPPHEAPEPFHYLAQYRAATHLALAPAAALPPAAGAPRTMVLSVGRCGSTLLVALATWAGLAALSEPDALTPLGLDRAPPPGAAAIYAPLVDACLEGWRAGASEGPALVKLRAQHSNAAHVALMIGALADPLLVFVFREPRAWARSMAGHFGLPVERLVALYAGPIAAHAAARRAGVRAAVLTYEAMVADPDAALAALGLPAGAARLPERGAQDGTRLARPPARDAASERTVDAFMERWPDLRAGAAEGAELDWPG